MASSFIRCEDPALLAQALASPTLEQLSLRALAPTVAVSPAPIADVLAGLRTAGFAPAAEDWSGTIVDLRPLGARVSTPIHRRTFRHPQAPNEKTLGAIVAVLRQTGRGGNGERLDPAAAISLLMVHLKRRGLGRRNGAAAETTEQGGDTVPTQQ